MFISVSKGYDPTTCKDNIFHTNFQNIFIVFHAYPPPSRIQLVFTANYHIFFAYFLIFL